MRGANIESFNFMKKFSVNFIILVLVIWQFFSVLLMAIGNWPVEVVWVNLFISLIFLLLADNFHSLLFLIVSIPF